MKKYTILDKETAAYCKAVGVDRPKDWPSLDISVIESEVGGIDSYEYKMIQNSCKTEEEAINAIQNKRKADSDYDDFMEEAEKNDDLITNDSLYEDEEDDEEDSF